MGRVLGIALLALWCTGLMPDDVSAESSPINTAPRGFLFVNGRFLPPPYTAVVDEGFIRINDVEYTEEEFDLSIFGRESGRSIGRGDWHGGRRGEFGRRFGGRAERSGMASPQGRQSTAAANQSRSFRQLKNAIEMLQFGGAVVLMSEHQPISVVDPSDVQDLLQALISDSNESDRQLTVKLASVTPQSATPQSAGQDGVGTGLPFLRNAAQQKTWESFQREFVSSDDFERHYAQYMQVVREVGEESRRVVASSQFNERFAYPLTLVAMALVVFGFGHLLSNRPTLDTSPNPQSGVGGAIDLGYQRQARKVVGLSLLIVVLLATIDLLFTLGSHQAGVMRELNPMGRGLITDPMLLFAFKAVLTASSVGILFWLHHRPIAQLASWWSCLLMTLLTARWVMFQSMFL